MKKFLLTLIGGAMILSATSCNCKEESPLKAKVEEYAPVELSSDLVSTLSENEKEIVKIFFEIGHWVSDFFVFSRKFS